MGFSNDTCFVRIHNMKREREPSVLYVFGYDGSTHVRVESLGLRPPG